MDQSQPNVLVPTQWMNFFNLLLLKQSSFDWAKDLLQSPAWQLISGDSLNEGYCFSLPSSKPSISISEIACSDCEVHDNLQSASTMLTGPQDDVTLEVTPHLEDVHFEQTAYQSPSSAQDPSNTPTRDNKGKQLYISEEGLRRSNRIHNLNRGFKSPSKKEKKCCLGCDCQPPTLSFVVVRNLGVTFCNLKPDQIDQEILMDKPSPKKRAVGQPRKTKGKEAPPKDQPDNGGKGKGPKK